MHHPDVGEVDPVVRGWCAQPTSQELSSTQPEHEPDPGSPGPGPRPLTDALFRPEPPEHAAGEQALGATLYVTLEPCSHQGKTPPCTESIIKSGVVRVVYGASDPNPAAGGGGEILRKAGIEVKGGVEAEHVRAQPAPERAAILRQHSV